MSNPPDAMWVGVTGKSWSFLSPPGLLRGKGVLQGWSKFHLNSTSRRLGIRTGEYTVLIDEPGEQAIEAVENSIHNEDMAVAIVDEAENNKLAFTHWSCTGPIDLGRG
ncbi:hypothetical protein EDB80DRAFT_675640 [Ilyonectria destructans]|nr:hypothetical protein EDB80DRAFT_675640 [Ilyonectria destructans]